MITRRGYWAIAAALAGLVIAMLTLEVVLLFLAVVVFAFLGANLIVFHVQTADLTSGSLTARRSATFSRVPRSVDSVTSVTVRYAGRHGFWAEFVDVAPDAFEMRAGRRRLVTWWDPGTEKTLAYAFRSRVRGALVVGPTVVTAYDPLGIARRSARLPTSRPVTVLPSAVPIRPGPIGRALVTPAPGRMVVRRRGFGTEFRSLRPYQSTDDIRHVAWKRSTLEQIYVREFEQESRQDYLLIIDLSEEMRSGQWGEAAIDRSVDAATVVVHAIARQGEDRVGLLTYVNGVFQYLPPGRGPRQYKRLTDNLALMAVRPGRFDLGDALGQATRRLTQHSHVFSFSPLRGPTQGLAASLARFRSRGHRLYQFVPEIEGFYPTPTDPVGAEVFDWAADGERRRREAVIAVLQRQGIPVFPFDRGGAAEKVMSAYYRIRAWENAR
ncbi:MAG: DUF58 domain-containing protein [Thermoplasmata archaeon]